MRRWGRVHYLNVLVEESVQLNNLQDLSVLGQQGLTTEKMKTEEEMSKKNGQNGV